MGIMVQCGTIPSGVSVSNVYISFGSEPLYILPNGGLYRITTHYRIYSTQTKELGTDIRIPFTLNISNIDQNVYTAVYNELKCIYPNNIDCI